MTLDSPASHGLRGALAFGSLLLVCVAPPAATSAHAQARTVLLFRHGEPAGANAWRARVAAHALAEVVHDLASWAASRARGVEPQRLAALADIEVSLARARAEAAALDERGALATLADAARAGEQIADVPGAALWNAEIQLGIGVTAAQAGLRALAVEAFRRATTLDRERALLPAEAPPAVVELFAGVARQVALAPVGEIEVQVDAAGAGVYLDDALQGLAPVRLRAPVGRHVLRVHAEGRRTYGAFIDVLEGTRPALHVQTAPEPLVTAAAALLRAGRAGDYTAVVAAAGALERAGGGLTAVHVLEHSEASARALLVRCDARSCAAPARFVRGTALAPAGEGALDAAMLAETRRWLSQPEPMRAEPARGDAWWQQWYVWGGVAAAAASAIAVLAIGAAQAPERRLRVVLEPEELAR